MNKQKVFTKSFVVALVGVLLLGGISLYTGVYDIYGQADGMQMFFITRVPRTAALMLTGAAMSMAGLVMQLITQNRCSRSYDHRGPSSGRDLAWC